MTVRGEDAVPLAETNTLGGLIVTVGSGALELESGCTEVVNDTVLVNELRLLTLIVDTVDWPCIKDSELGLAPKLKSGEVFEILQAVSG